MQQRELAQIVESTGDAAFAVDGAGLVIAWNGAAESLFGVTAKEARGRRCGELLHGDDECGPVCGESCSVQQAVHSDARVANFDLRVRTAGGPRWCSVSVLQAHVQGVLAPCSIHVLRPNDTGKRLELLVRDYLVAEAGLGAEQIRSLLASGRSPTREAPLTARELEILRLLAAGRNPKVIAEQLHVSRTTVNNHIQHAIRKLNVHSRLEAIRRAERAGLL